MKTTKDKNETRIKARIRTILNEAGKCNPQGVRLRETPRDSPGSGNPLVDFCTLNCLGTHWGTRALLYDASHRIQFSPQDLAPVAKPLSQRVTAALIEEWSVAQDFYRGGDIGSHPSKFDRPKQIGLTVRSSFLDTTLVIWRDSMLNQIDQSMERGEIGEFALPIPGYTVIRADAPQNSPAPRNWRYVLTGLSGAITIY
jgi:hypothetical protein